LLRIASPGKHPSTSDLSGVVPSEYVIPYPVMM